MGDRTFKLPPGTTSGYGRYVKSLRGAPSRADQPQLWNLARNTFRYYDEVTWSDAMVRSTYLNLSERMSGGGDVNSAENLLKEAMTWAEVKEDKALRAFLLLSGSKGDRTYKLEECPPIGQQSNVLPLRGGSALDWIHLDEGVDPGGVLPDGIVESAVDYRCVFRPGDANTRCCGDLRCFVCDAQGRRRHDPEKRKEPAAPCAISNGLELHSELYRPGSWPRRVAQ